MGNKNRLSFMGLFNGERVCGLQNDSTLTIPRIQRDYAQGRQTSFVSEVRKGFLDTLEEYLGKPEEIHDLDFVYGYTSENTFTPLDGQQRLTTLFLLHWYIAKKCEGTSVSRDFFAALTIETQGVKHCRFSYDTRDSSADFCDRLISEKIELNSGKSISECIMDKDWYDPDWNLDPTIKGMLVMLDAINKRFGYWTNLEFLLQKLSGDDSPISFIFTNLDDYNLSDDLYIKMNSRGKPLTDFENFKAKFEQKIEEIANTDQAGVFNELKTEIEKNKGQKGIEDVRGYFSFNFDTEWTQFFWTLCRAEVEEAMKKDLDADTKERQYSLSGKLKYQRREKALENLLDAKLGRFIRVMLGNAYAFYLDKEIPGTLLGEKAIKYNDLNEVGAFTAETVKYLIDGFKTLSENGVVTFRIGYHEGKPVFFDLPTMFNDLLNGKDIGFIGRTRLWAYLQYLKTFKNEEEGLREWMKFVYNVTERFNGPDILNKNLKNALQDLNVWLVAMKDAHLVSIDEALCLNKITTNIFFEEYQIKEEVVKAKLRTSAQFSDKVETLEGHPYFNGQIGFILKISGILDIDVESPLETYMERAEKKFSKFWDYGQIASKIFEGGYLERKLADDALFERAMLTINPDYTFGYNFLNSKTGSDNVRRDNSWKRWLRNFNQEDQRLYSYMSILFDKLNPALVNQEANQAGSLRYVIDQYPDNLSKWSILVHNSSLIGYCINGAFNKKDETTGLLILHPYQTYHAWDRELFSAHLWNTWIEPHTSEGAMFEGFKYAGCNILRAEGDYPHIETSIESGEELWSLSIYSELHTDTPVFYLWLRRNSWIERDLERLIVNLESAGFERQGEQIKFKKSLKGIDFYKIANKTLVIKKEVAKLIEEEMKENEQPAE